MTRALYINVFEREDGSQFLGEPHLSAVLCRQRQGPPRRFYFGSRPVYRLRVTLKASAR